MLVWQFFFLFAMSNRFVSLLRNQRFRYPQTFLTATMSTGQLPIEAAITKKLSDTFQPSHLEVLNESYMHSVPKNAETHFKIIIVSDKFAETKSPVQRHKLVNSALSEELDGPVHALSIVAKSPDQWQTMLDEGKAVDSSPKCRGGYGS